jgi:hypothetical protein
MYTGDSPTGELQDSLQRSGSGTGPEIPMRSVPGDADGEPDDADEEPPSD